MNKKQKIAILGQGAWASAIATILVSNGHDVALWCHDETVAHEINTRHTNQYLPGIDLPSSVWATTDIKKALENVEWIFEAIPVQYLRENLIAIQPHINSKHRWVVLSKGIE